MYFDVNHVAVSSDGKALVVGIYNMYSQKPHQSSRVSLDGVNHHL